MVPHIGTGRGSRESDRRAQLQAPSEPRQGPEASGLAAAVNWRKHERLSLAFLPRQFITLHEVQCCIDERVWPPVGLAGARINVGRGAVADTKFTQGHVIGWIKSGNRIGLPWRADAADGRSDRSVDFARQFRARGA